jgi:hypothetical protein
MKIVTLVAVLCVAVVGCGPRSSSATLPGCYIPSLAMCQVPLGGCTGLTGAVSENPCHSDGVVGCCTQSDRSYNCYYTAAAASAGQAKCTSPSTWSTTVP